MAAYRVALTGGVASGKSTVGRMFHAKGIVVLDADVISRELVSPGQPALKMLADQIGDFILQDGELDRAVLRQIILTDADARARVNAVLHPLIYEALSQQAARADGPYCILEVPLLLETAPMGLFDRVLLVDCSEAQQLSRGCMRSGWTESQVRSVLSIQATRSDRLAYADDVIENTKDFDFLWMQVEGFHERYLLLAKNAQFRHS